VRPEGQQALLFELADSLFKNWWTIVAGLCFGVAGAMAALHFLPKVYVAGTKIRIAPQSIPEDFVRTTVTDDMSQRLMEIQEAILSREYLDQLIEHNFGVPPTEQAREDLMRFLSDRVQVERRRESRMCTLTYRDTDAERAARVINELTDLYVKQNREFRATQAGSTREQFDERAAAAKTELDEVERRINEYLAEHRFETTDFRDANLQLLETRSRDLETNEREQRMAEMRLADLRSRSAQAGGTASSAGGTATTTGDPRALRIRELRRQLQDLRARYGDAHPDVQRAEGELDDLLADVQARPFEEGGQDAPLPLDPQLAALSSQISATDQELAGLQARESSLRREIAEIERRLERTPRVQADFDELDERRRILDERYRDLVAKAERARSSEFLEQTDQGQRIEIIERAEVPVRPAYPEPLRIYGIGLVVGCLVFVGPLLLRNLLNPVVVSEAGLRGAIEVPVLVGIPRLETPATAGLGRRRMFKNVALALLSSGVLAAVAVTLQRFPVNW
jgi:polysaccharide chain length determinant protein (PEP-CTERM system associated)